MVLALHETLHETLCKRLKAKKVALHTIFLGVGGLSLPLTLCIILLSFDSQRAHNPVHELRAHSVHYVHKVTSTSSLS